MRISCLSFTLSILLGALLPGANTVAYARQAQSAQKQPHVASDASIVHPFGKTVPIPPTSHETIRKADGTEKSVLRPLRDGSPPPKDSHGQVQHVNRIAEEIYTYLDPPKSLVSRTSSTTIYSRDINVPRCVARGAKRDWIGTPIGVKYVDRETKTVRIFVDSNGLPAGSVEAIATDETGEAAVVLVRRHIHTRLSQNRYPDQDDEFSLCLFEPKVSRWRVLETFPAPTTSSAFFSGMGRDRLYVGYQLALTKNAVAVLPAEVSTADPAPFKAYERATGKPISVPWEEFVQADFLALRISGVVRVGEMLYLATDLGVLRYDFVSQGWQRFLPNQEIYQIAPHPRDPDTAAILSAPRQSPPATIPRAMSPRPLVAGPQSQVSLLSLKTGAVIGSPLTLPNENPAVGSLSLAPDGSFWLTYVSTFYGTDPARQVWRAVAPDGTVSAPGEGMKQPEAEFPAAFYNLTIPTIASAETIPDEAIVSRILLPSHDDSFSHSFPEPRRYMIYQRQRFPFWLSPDDAKERIGALKDASRYAYALTVDPTDPRFTWGLGGGRLIRLPSRIASQAPVAASYLAPFFAPRTITGRVQLPAATSLDTFSLFDPASARSGARIPLSVATIAPVPDATDAVYIVSGGDVLRYEANADASVKLPMPGKHTAKDTSAQLISNHPTLLLSSGTLYRLSPNADTIELIRTDPGRYTSHLSRAGAWRTTSDALEFLPLNPDGTASSYWHLYNVRDELKKIGGKASADFLAVTGSIAWYRAFFASGGSTMTAAVMGYDVAKNAWTPPLPISSALANSALKITETPLGDALFSIPGYDGWVYQFRSGDTAWARVVSVPDEIVKERFYRVSQAQDGSLFLTNPKYVGTYNTQVESWELTPLPESFPQRGLNTFDLEGLQSASTKDGIYVGGANTGAWRWSRADKTWRQIQKEVAWIPTDASGDSYSLAGIAVNKSAVWAFGAGAYNKVPMLIRWDRKTRKAHFVAAQEAGFPLHLSQRLRMIGVGDTMLVWADGASGVYRVESGSDRFQRISDVAVYAAQADPSDANTVFWISSDTLYRYNETTKQTTSYPLDLPQVLPDNHYAIIRGANNLVVTKDAVYIGTVQGAYRFDRRTQTVEIVPQTQSLSIDRLQREGDTLVLGSENTLLRIKL